jgi:tetratricopeptide (TPR) repeat protein
LSSQTSLELALEHHKSGRFEDAERIYDQILASEPGHARALHLLGVMALQRGQLERAVDLISRALEVTPDNVYFLNDLGEAHRALGATAEAADCYQRCLAIDPRHTLALNNLALVHAIEGRLEAAESCLRRALDITSDDPRIHANLGDIMVGRGLCTEAMVCFERSLELAPSLPGVHKRLGTLLFDQENFDAALTRYREAVQVEPTDLDARRHLAVTLHRCGELEQAESSFRAVLATDPGNVEALNGLTELLVDTDRFAEGVECSQRALGVAHAGLAQARLRQHRFSEAESASRDAIAIDAEHAKAHFMLGYALFHLNRIEEASDAFLVPVRKLRALDIPFDKDKSTFNRISYTKLQQDIEQLEYLLQHERISSDFSSVLDAYRGFERRYAAHGDRTSLMEVSSDHAIAPYYNRYVLDAPEPSIAGGALNPDLDTAAVEAAFHNSPLGFTYFDNLLCDEALAGLQRYCLEPSIWFEMKFHSEVGSGLCNGFCCPLLLQIAAEIKSAFPSVFGEHLFTTCWTYKYFQEESDGHLHADRGAASVNLWITPDESNLEPDKGGLVIWNKAVPRGFFRSSSSQQVETMNEISTAPDAEPGYVPYGCNRAMMFRSNVLHKTERLCFENGYPHRRVSITFLYGKPEN